MKRIAQIFLVLLLISMPLEAQKSSKANNSSETRIKELEARVETLETKLAEIINYLNATNQSKQVKQDKNFTLTLYINEENLKRNGQSYYDQIVDQIKKRENIKYVNPRLSDHQEYHEGNDFFGNAKIDYISHISYYITIGFFPSKIDAMTFYTEHFHNYNDMELSNISIID